MSHYDVLGLKPNATQSEIKVAFEKLADAYNSDPDPARATESAKAVAEAYRVLRDPKHRKEYDQHLEWLDSPVGSGLPERPRAGNGAISQEEFGRWVNAGRVTEGLAEKIRADQCRREKQIQKEQRRRESIRAGLLWPFKLLGLLLGLAFVVALAVLGLWALITAVRWLWEHPLW